MMLAPAIVSVGMNLTPHLARTAVGPDGGALEIAIERIFEDRALSCFYSANLLSSEAELGAVAREAATPNWDGYGAVPVRASAVAHAECFLQLLPSTCRAPEFSIHPDGMVAFEWTWGRRQMISLALDGSGIVYYAASIGRDTRHGASYVSDALPQVLREVLAPIC